jgi:hypothetical protein
MTLSGHSLGGCLLFWPSALLCFAHPLPDGSDNNIVFFTPQASHTLHLCISSLGPALKPPEAEGANLSRKRLETFYSVSMHVHNTACIWHEGIHWNGR